MCSFLTLGVDANRAASLEATLRAAKLQVTRTINPHVARLFLLGALLAHAPTRAYFHEVSGDPLTERVPEAAQLVAF